MATPAGTPSCSPIPGLPSDTECVFRIFAAQACLRDFVLIGGTAMALQMRHRLSEDLDFWLPDGRLSDREIRPALNAADRAGLPVHFTTPHHQVTRFRINTGERLEGYARDYSVGGVKVQFFAPMGQDRANDRFKSFLAVTEAIVVKDAAGQEVSISFRVMSMDGLFAMKAHAIQRRHRSRDVLDLWHFVKAGRTIADIVDAGAVASSTASPGRAIAVLRGEIDLDESDEGFHSLSADVTIERVRADFHTWTDEYEQARASAIKSARAGQAASE